MARTNLKRQSSTSAKKPRTKKPINGAGDVIEAITEAIGIRSIVESFEKATGIDCGCEARREALNRLLPRVKPECLTRDEYNFIEYIKDKNTVTADDQRTLNDTYNRVMHDRVSPTGCSSCIDQRIKALVKVQSAYKEAPTQ